MHQTEENNTTQETAHEEQPVENKIPLTFADLGLKPEIVKALAEEGIVTPTTIQEIAIPLILKGEDLIGMSRTGSGKTVAFGAPLLHHIEHGYGIQVLILAPTRELAVQIAGEIKKFSKYLDNVGVATVFGGVAIDPQIEEIAYADIVVATPGRLLDHVERRTIDLSGIFSLVLDEGDKMAEMGFIEDIEAIIGLTPPDRQILLFGATIAGEVERLRDTYMYRPKVAKAELKVEEDLLEQYFYNVLPHEKFSLLMHILKTEKTDRVMIFCSARSTVDIVSNNLTRQGIKNEMIHGMMTQNKRLKVIEDFNRGRVKVLVASPVAARGLDIRDISHVINYDLASDAQEYVHRIGRTARAGDSGKAITLLTQKDHDPFNAVLKYYDLKVKELPKGNFPRVPFDAGPRRDSYGGERREGGRSGYGFGGGGERGGPRGGSGFGDRPPRGRAPAGSSRSGHQNSRGSPSAR